MLSNVNTISKKGRSSVGSSNCVRNTIFSITAYPTF